MVVVTTMLRNMTSSNQNRRIHTQTNWNIDTLCVWYETIRQLIHAHVDHSDYIGCFNKHFSMSSWAELSIWFRKHYTTKFNDRDENNTKWYYNDLEFGGSMASCRVCVQLQHLGQFWPYTTSVNLPNWNTDIRRHLDHCHWTYISQ